MPAWLEKFGPSIFAALLAALASLTSAFLVPWFQERRRARREHLEAIKDQVLRPVHEELERFYLPLLQGGLGPVMSQHVALPAPGSVTQAPTTWEKKLTPRRKYGDQPDPYLATARPDTRVNPELYADAKNRHYRKFIRRLEAFKAEVESHTASLLPYAERLSKTIADRAGLPVITAQSANTRDPWVDASGLAVFLLDRQLGATQQSPNIMPDPPSLDIGGWTMARGHTREQMQRVVEALDELYQDQQTVEALRRRAEPLERQAAVLLGELNQLRLSSKLPGRCKLAKV